MGKARPHLSTVKNSWDVILGELTKISNQHAEFGQQLKNDVGTHISSHVKDKEVTRKKVLALFNP